MSTVRLDSADSQNARVFIGNVAPNTDTELLEERFKKHGNVVGVVVLKGFAFVQFEKESEAKCAIDAENGTDFQGKRIDVKMAKRKPQEEKKDDPPPQQQEPIVHEVEPMVINDNDNYDNGRFRGNQNNDRGGGQWRGSRGRGNPRGGVAPYHNNRRDDQYDDGNDNKYNRQRNDYPAEDYNGGRYRGPVPNRQPPPQQQPPQEDKNDCEIICVSKGQRQYAEMIESRLKNIGLKVDILFPNPDIPLGKILDNITSRGVHFAIVVTQINEQHRSLTLNVLQGQQQEHRNMPLENAIGFIAKNFEAVVEGKTVVGQDNVLPEDIRTVLGFLADNRPLSVMEYDKLIRYFASKREAVLKMEYGENIPPSLATPPIGPPMDPIIKAKQDELQERILSILNRQAAPKEVPQITPVGSSLGGSASIAPELNASLQRAIDSLIKTGPNLLSQITQSTAGSQFGYNDSSTTGNYSSLGYGREKY